MDKKVAGLLGAVAGLASTTSGQAAVSTARNASEALEASSYADLLTDIPNARAALEADNTARAQKTNVITAQYYPYYGPPPYYGPAPYAAPYYHHHHHHHHHQMRYRHHHHHHHHHGGAFIGVPGLGGVVVR